MKVTKVLLKISSINFLPLFVSLFCFFVFTPLSLAAPQVSAVLDSTGISANKDFNLYVQLDWQGDADDYIIVPPEPELPEGIILAASSFFSSVSNETQRVKYHYVLKAQTKGKFTIKPLRIKYWAKGSDQESFLLTDDLPFEVVTFAFWRFDFVWTLIIIGSILVAVILFTIFMSKRVSPAKKEVPAGQEEPDREYITEKLRECRQYKLRGDPVGFYQCAIDLAKKIPDQDKEFMVGLTDALERVRFGGHRPASEEIERGFRYIEKRAAGIISAKKDQDLEYLKYCKPDQKPPR